MKAINPGTIALRVHIGLMRVGVIPGVIATLLLLGVAIWIGFAINTRVLQQERILAQVQQGQREPLAVTARESEAKQNLRKFYDALGDRSEAEQNLKVLFGIAAEMDISLDQGEYQWQFDRNSGTYRYQVILPVKGAYGAIRQFCEEALLALPFASLDELSFKRESVGEDTLDANLHFTFYMNDVPRVPQQAGMGK